MCLLCGNTREQSNIFQTNNSGFKYSMCVYLQMIILQLILRIYLCSNHVRWSTTPPAAPWRCVSLHQMEKLAAHSDAVLRTCLNVQCPCKVLVSYVWTTWGLRWSETDGMSTIYFRIPHRPLPYLYSFHSFEERKIWTFNLSVTLEAKCQVSRSCGIQGSQRRRVLSHKW